VSEPIAGLPDPLTIPTLRARIDARVMLPGSKSYTNRALPIAALARGRSVLRGVLDSEDTRFMVEALKALGVAVDADWTTDSIAVDGTDGVVPATAAKLFLGNSGTSMRFLTALATLAHGDITLDGTQRMRQRPLGPLIDGLASLGIRIRSEQGNGCPPVTITASGLPGGIIRMPGNVSSQYFSAIAMVSPYASDRLEIEVDGDLVSKPYLDMTVSTMGAFGVRLHHRDYRRIWTEPGQRYLRREYAIEPDASAASYFFALAAVTAGRVTVENLPPDSAQGDVRFVDVLERMGCTVVRGAREISVIGPRQLRGVQVDMNAISDTVPTLAAIAPFASSPVVIQNVRHIRFKETDRLSAIATELRRLGVPVDETQDSLKVSPATPRVAVVQTYDDHRMAMSFAVTGARVPGLQIADPGCVGKTVPRFWDILFPLLGATPSWTPPRSPVLPTPPGSCG
jgi:3-phosphoshikimate 1-carboxyvinyltransferase